MAIDKEVLDQFLAGRDPQELFAKDGLIDELKKALSERMLVAELEDHLESEIEAGISNRRNGSSKKTICCAALPMGARSCGSARFCRPSRCKRCMKSAIRACSLARVRCGFTPMAPLPPMCWGARPLALKAWPRPR